MQKMHRNARSFLWASSGAALVVALGAEGDETGIQAPWTGLTLAAAALAFVAAGIVGRGWRALMGALVLGVPAAVILAIDLTQASEVEAVASCDRGCPPGYFYVVILTVIPALLITAGMVLRRLSGWFRRYVLGLGG
ncbi:MAG: hypothetical protein ACRDLS_08995 [Solirubrobacteraceae bacterium]